MKFIRILFFLFIIINGNNLFSQENGFPKIMYVTSKEGLSKREEPSINSKKIGTLLFAERTIVLEQGPQVTIDGIANYWYKCLNRPECWVFGGYLSEEFPLDAPIVIGRWDCVGNTNISYRFLPNGVYGAGFKESGMGLYGNWILNGNRLTINVDHVGTASDEINETDIVTVTIIDRNNIILNFINTKVNPTGERQVRLTRSSELWVSM
jgi:hypothetical protein